MSLERDSTEVDAPSLPDSGWKQRLWLYRKLAVGPKTGLKDGMGPSGLNRTQGCWRLWRCSETPGRGPGVYLTVKSGEGYMYFMEKVSRASGVSADLRATSDWAPVLWRARFWDPLHSWVQLPLRV